MLKDKAMIIALVMVSLTFPVERSIMSHYYFFFRVMNMPPVPVLDVHLPDGIFGDEITTDLLAVEDLVRRCLDLPDAAAIACDLLEGTVRISQISAECAAALLQQVQYDLGEKVGVATISLVPEQVESEEVDPYDIGSDLRFESA